MKLIDDLDKLNGKTIAFNVKNLGDNILVLGTTDSELIFLNMYEDHMYGEPRFEVLDFYDSKDELKKDKGLFKDIKEALPGILGNLTDELKTEYEKEKEAEEYKLYQKLEKKYGRRSTLSGPVF